MLSMSRLGSRLLSELGGSKRTFIDKYGRHMILSQVAREEKENLQVFRGLESRSSFIDMVNNFISELKQYDFWLASYTDRMDFPYRVDMWQYTDTGSIPGIDTACDFNVYFPSFG